MIKLTCCRCGKTVFTSERYGTLPDSWMVVTSETSDVYPEVSPMFSDYSDEKDVYCSEECLSDVYDRIVGVR